MDNVRGQAEPPERSLPSGNLQLSSPSRGAPAGQSRNITNHLFPGTSSQNHLHKSFVGNVFNTSGDVNVWNNTGASGEDSADIKKQLLRTLYFKEMHSRRRQIGKRAASPESMEWIWSTAFSEWLREPLQLFWISGLPGSGKSTLMKYLSESEDTRQALEDDGSEWIIIHFFFDFRSRLAIANSVDGFVRSLLYQLVNKIPELATELYHTRNEVEEEWNDRYQDLDNLLEDFCEAVQSTYIKVCAFVDGLDEFQGKPSELLAILDTMKNRTRLKICLASRPEPSLKPRLVKYPHIFMQDHNSSSMHWYIDYAWDGVGANKSSTAVQDLSNQIIRHARGSFLWARMVIDDVSLAFLSGDSHEQLAEKVKAMPKEVADLYETILDRLFLRQRCEAAILLHMLVEAGGAIELDRLEAAFWTMQKRGHLGSLVLPQNYSDTFRSKLMTVVGGFLDISCLHSDQGIDDCPTCNKQGDDKVGLHIEKDNRWTVRLSHETLSSFLQRGKWLPRNLPSELLQRYPDRLWLRLYLTEIQIWSSAIDDPWSQVIPIVRNIARCHIYMIDNPIREDLQQEWEFRQELAVAFREFPQFTTLLNAALHDLLIEFGRHKFLESDSLLAETLSVFRSPMFLVHPLQCIAYSDLFGYDEEYDCRYLKDSRMASKAFTSEWNPDQVATAVCIAHGYIEMLITYVQGNRMGNTLDVQFIFDFFFERYVIVADFSQVETTRASRMLVSLLCLGAKLKSEHICLMLRHNNPGKREFFEPNVLDFVAEHCGDLKLDEHTEDCPFGSLPIPHANFAQSTSFLIDWAHRPEGRIADEEICFEYGAKGLSILLKLGQDIDGPCDPAGRTLLDLIMADGGFAGSNDIGDDPISFACLVRAGANINCLDNYLDEMGGVLVAEVRESEIFSYLKREARDFQACDPATLSFKYLMRWYEVYRHLKLHPDLNALNTRYLSYPAR